MIYVTDAESAIRRQLVTNTTDTLVCSWTIDALAVETNSAIFNAFIDI